MTVRHFFVVIFFSCSSPLSLLLLLRHLKLLLKLTIVFVENEVHLDDNVTISAQCLNISLRIQTQPWRIRPSR